jgi:hypothetical protein
MSLKNIVMVPAGNSPTLRLLLALRLTTSPLAPQLEGWLVDSTIAAVMPASLTVAR